MAYDLNSIFHTLCIQNSTHHFEMNISYKTMPNLIKYIQHNMIICLHRETSYLRSSPSHWYFPSTSDIISIIRNISCHPKISNLNQKQFKLITRHKFIYNVCSLMLKYHKLSNRTTGLPNN